MKFKLVKFNQLNILKQLQLEESLLRNTTDNWLVVNRGHDEKAAIVLGFSGKPSGLLNVDNIVRDNVTVIRRYTGGGTVVVDHNTLFISFICNSKELAVQPYPREIMSWTETIYSPLFQKLIRSDHDDTKQFRLHQNDYVIDNKKIGGNAQTITKDRWVHHTSFLWDYDPQNMSNYLLIPEKRPEYRNDRSHADFVTKLKDHLDGTVTLEVLEEALVHQLTSFGFEIEQDRPPHLPLKVGEEGEEEREKEYYQWLMWKLKEINPQFECRSKVEAIVLL